LQKTYILLKIDNYYGLVPQDFNRYEKIGYRRTGKTSQAKRIYSSLATERDYYGFLAADRIKAKYKMQHNPVSFTETDTAHLMKNPSLAGAHEFYKISKFSDKQELLLNARREWKYAIEHFYVC